MIARIIRERNATSKAAREFQRTARDDAVNARVACQLAVARREANVLKLREEEARRAVA